MTTIQEVYNAVTFRYMRETAARKMPQTEIQNGEFKLMYDIVVQEIFRKLNISDITTEIAITPVTVLTEYALPSSYGGLRSYECTFNDTKVNLELVDINELPTAGDLTQGTPTKIAIYVKSDGLSYVYLSPLSGFTGTLKVRYKYVKEIEDGAGSGLGLTAATEMPRIYEHLLIHGIMGELISDMKEQYYVYLKDAIGDRTTPVKATMNYNLGFDEEGDNETNLGI